MFSSIGDLVESRTVAKAKRLEGATHFAISRGFYYWTEKLPSVSLVFAKATNAFGYPCVDDRPLEWVGGDGDVGWLWMPFSDAGRTCDG